MEKIFCTVYHDGEADFGTYFTSKREAQKFLDAVIKNIEDEDGEPFDNSTNAVEVVEIDDSYGCKVYDTCDEAVADGQLEL